MQKNSGILVAVLAITALTVTLISYQQQPTVVQTQSFLYGIVETVHRDSEGNIIQKQVTHNRLTDEGEDFLIKQVFKNGTAVNDNVAMGTMCLYSGSPKILDFENTTAAIFDTKNVNSQTEKCFPTSTGNVDTSKRGLAIINAKFVAPTNVTVGQNVTGIAICQALAGGGNKQSCGESSGLLLSVIKLNNQTLQNDDTITIKYTFNATTPTT